MGESIHRLTHKLNMPSWNVAAPETSFSETDMREDLQKCLEEMRRVLDATRNLRYAADIDHSYVLLIVVI